MTQLADLDAALAAFAEEWAQSTIAGCDDAMAAATTMTDEGVLRCADAFAHLQRAMDAYKVALAGENAERSKPLRGRDGMARRAGFRSSAHHLSAIWGITVGEAHRFCRVGTGIRPRIAMDGSLYPARYDAVRGAVHRGELGVESAVHIIRELESASPRCSYEALHWAEVMLVTRAPAFCVDDVAVLARQMRNRLDQDGSEPRDEQRQRRRALRLQTRHNGMITMQWDMPPEVAGLVTASIDAIVGRDLHRAREEKLEEERTLEQHRSDAATELFRHLATCSHAGGDLPAVTMVVRMSVDALMSGLGVAEIDGVGETISAATARKLAVDAKIVPIVLGGPGEVLDYGKGRRLFSRAQHIALVERYGGCAWGACSSPPAYTEAHHIEWWSTRPNTDLANGIPLCSFHHHRVHDDGWEIEFREGIPYFLPPPWAHCPQTPIRGGRVLLPAAA
jgi:hypothetical protein